MDILPSSEVIKNLRAALMASLEVIHTEVKDSPPHVTTVKEMGIAALYNNTNQTQIKLKEFRQQFSRYHSRDAVSERAENSLCEYLRGEKQLYEIYQGSRYIASDNEPYYGG